MEKQFVLKAKTAVKRVAAISAGATMMGATMMGAVAADLGDYPSPFVSQGELNGMVVVGSGANAGDIVGAGDLISTLTQATVSAGSATTVTEGGEDAEIVLGDGSFATSFGTLTDSDVAGLLDDELEWNDTEIEYHEEVILDDNMLLLTSGENGEEEMGSDVYLGTDGVGFEYRFVFDSDITGGNAGRDLIANLDSDETLTIDILGKSVEISSMTNTTFTYKLADEYSLFVGDTVTVDGQDVTLVNVASGSNANVVVTVGGEQETVGAVAETVNGLKVQVSETFYSDNLNERFAVLYVGDDISQVATNGQPVELFGGEDDDTDNPYEWNIDLDESGGSGFIGIEYDAISDNLDDDFPPVGVGESIAMPNNYVNVKLDSMTSETYSTLSIETGSTENINNSNYWVIELSSDDEEAFYLDSEEVDNVYIAANPGYGDGSYDEEVDEDRVITAFYQDSEGDWQSVTVDDTDGSSGLQYQYANGEYIDLLFDGNVSSLGGEGYQLTIDSSDHETTAGIDDDVVVVITHSSNNKTQIGVGEDEAAADVTIGGSNMGSKEDDMLFEGGLILRDPESSLQGSGSLEILIPEEEVKANVIVTGPGTTTTTQQFSQVTVNSVAGQSVIKLDTEVTDPQARNLILVGGPAVNRLTAQAMGLTYPTSGADSGIPEGAALIKLVENAFGGSNSALVVAGWDAEDTRAAASVLQNYRSYANSLDGRMEVQVSGTSVTAVGGDVATN